VEAMPDTTHTSTDAPLSSRVHVTAPQQNTTVGQRFEVKGEAPGNWFFEASFPIEVLDVNGVVIARAIAQAEGDWMTSEFVPFKADIVIPPTYIGKSTLLLKKDNPSDLRENDASISFPFTIEY
jgi:hypothetical protein